MHSNTSLSGWLASCRIALAAFALLAARPVLADDMAAIESMPPAAFPDLSYKDAQDTAHTLKSDLGKLTLVHFWATWCGPCVQELPALDRLQKDYGGKGLKVVSLSEDAQMPTVLAFYAEHNIANLPTNLDIDTSAFREVNGRGIPTSYILDSTGRKIALAEGPVDWQGKQAVDFIEGHLK